MAEHKVVFDFEVRTEKALERLTGLQNVMAMLRDVRGPEELVNRLREMGFTIGGLTSMIDRFKRDSVLGLHGAYSKLTPAQRQQVETLRSMAEEYKKTNGLTAQLKTGFMSLGDSIKSQMGVISSSISATFGQLVSGFKAGGIIGLIGAGVAIGIRAFKGLIEAIKGAVDEIVKLGAENERFETRLIGIIGDVDAGRAAFKAYQDTIHNTATGMKTFSESSYASAIALGGREMGEAYLGAAKAMSATGRDADAFIKQILRLEKGLGVQKRTIISYSDVVTRAGLNVNRLIEGQYDGAEAAARLKEAIAAMGAEQERAARGTFYGQVELLKGVVSEIKEDIGRYLLPSLRMIVEEVVKAVREVTSWEELWQSISDIAETGLKAAVIAIVDGIKVMVVSLKGAATIVAFLAKPFAGVFDIIQGLRRDTELWTAALARAGAIAAEIARGPVSLVRGGGSRIKTEFLGLRSDIALARAIGRQELDRGFSFGGFTMPLNEDYTASERMAERRHRVAGKAGQIETVQGFKTQAQLRLEELERYKKRREVEVAHGEEEYRLLQEEQKRALEAAETKAAATRMWTESLTDALLSGDVVGAFKQLATSFAIKAAQNLVVSGISGLPFRFPMFQTEGFVSRPTVAVVGEVPEYILRADTVAMLRAGMTPRGGGEGYRYDTGKASASAPISVNINPRVGALVDVAISEAAERGAAVRRGLRGR